VKEATAFTGREEFRSADGSYESLFESVANHFDRGHLPDH
jgi:hypothetical protein